MGDTFTTKDGVTIYYKDWGQGQPIVFHHGWPLSADDWDSQMLFFLHKGYRVIAHDRRGHSTGGGEVAAYVAKYGGGGRVSKAVLISAIPPLMLKTPENPEGLPIEVFDNFRAAMAARAQFYIDVAAGPFYGFNRPGVAIQQGVVDNWWRQGMMGSMKSHYECIKAFSETDFNDDLKKIDIPMLVMHGDDDQIVPFVASAPKAVKLLKKGTLKVYQGLPHGMPSTHADIINADLLAFIQG